MKRTLLFLLLFLFSPLAVSLQYCPDDASSTSTTPSFQFTTSENEVLDNSTGLTWKKCSLGLSGTDCSEGVHSRYSWQEALQVAKDYRNETGLNWRLPNIKELLSIIELSCNNPTVNLSIFPNTESGYWSSTNDSRSADSAWVANFTDGNTGTQLKQHSIYVRLVRSN